MVAFLSRQRLSLRGLHLSVAPLVAGILALFTALVFALMPDGFLENLSLDSGIAAVVPAAEPPLRATARAVLILGGGGGVGLVAWFGLFLLLGGRTISISRGKPVAAGPVVEGDVPVLRRADAHPDAPPRRPLFANRDLGTPFLDVHAARRAAVAAAPSVQPLPANLDLPMAAFDPGAIRDDPADWFPAPAQLPRAPRRQTFDAGERFETFALPAVEAGPPTVQPIRAPLPAPSAHAADHDPSASIHALLDRLERGVGRREGAPQPVSAPSMPPEPRIARGDSLEDALVSLRRLATRG